MTIPGGFVAGDILGAADMNLLPAGVIEYASVTAAQTAIPNTVTDLTSLTVTFTAVASRLYRVSFQVNVDLNWTSGSTFMQPYVVITDGSNNIKRTCSFERFSDDSDNIALSGFVLETGLSGSTTRKLRASAGLNGDAVGTIDIEASATQPAHILVEDIGPA